MTRPVVSGFRQVALVWQAGAGQGSRHCSKAAPGSPSQKAGQVMHAGCSCKKKSHCRVVSEKGVATPEVMCLRTACVCVCYALYHTPDSGHLGA